MRDHGAGEFNMDRLDPEWLFSRGQRWAAKGLSVLGSSLVGLIGGALSAGAASIILSSASPLPVDGGDVWRGGIGAGLALGFAMGLFNANKRRADLVNFASWAWASAAVISPVTLPVGLLLGAAYAPTGDIDLILLGPVVAFLIGGFRLEMPCDYRVSRPASALVIVGFGSLGFLGSILPLTLVNSIFGGWATGLVVGSTVSLLASVAAVLANLLLGRLRFSPNVRSRTVGGTRARGLLVFTSIGCLLGGVPLGIAIAYFSDSEIGRSRQIMAGLVLAASIALTILSLGLLRAQPPPRALDGWRGVSLSTFVAVGLASLLCLALTGLVGGVSAAVRIMLMVIPATALAGAAVYVLAAGPWRQTRIRLARPSFQGQSGSKGVLRCGLLAVPIGFILGGTAGSFVFGGEDFVGGLIILGVEVSISGFALALILCWLAMGPLSGFRRWLNKPEATAVSAAPTIAFAIFSAVGGAVIFPFEDGAGGRILSGAGALFGGVAAVVLVATFAALRSPVRVQVMKPGGSIRASAMTALLMVVLGSLCGSAFLGVFFSLSCGGAALMRNVSARLVLTRSGLAPLDLPKFLRRADERLLLLRIGNIYRFPHRALLDYFAELPISCSKEQIRIVDERFLC
jgi:hypothetical protein